MANEPNTTAYKHSHPHGTRHRQLMLGRIVVSLLLLVTLLVVDAGSLPLGGLQQGLVYYVVAYLIIGYDIVGKSVMGIVHGKVFDENFLMTVATLGAFGLTLYEQSGDYTEAVAVMLFFQTGELIEDYAVARGRRDILALMDNVPERVGKMASRRSGDFIARFARVYTPVVCCSALAVALLWPVVQLCMGVEAMWSEWMYRALTFLVISCPCALVIGVPLTFTAGIGGASRVGVLVRDANVLESLARVRPEALGDLRIAIGGVDSDTAIGTADVVLKDDDPQRIVRAIYIARKTLGIVWQNIVMAIGVKVICLVLGAFGIANMWLAIFADEGVMALAVVNAMRARGNSQV